MSQPHTADILKRGFRCITIAAALFVSSCATTNDGVDPGFPNPPPSWPELPTGPSDKQAGYERRFKDANTTMWIPSHVARIWDGHPTSGLYVGKTSPPGAFVKDYKISVYLKVSTGKTFEFYASKFPEWEFQEHPSLSVREKNGTTLMRKDLRDLQRGTVISITANVRPSSTAGDDIKTAMKMVESAKVLQK